MNIDKNQFIQKTVVFKQNTVDACKVNCKETNR